MTCEHTERWMTIISDDLRDAKRDLPGEPVNPRRSCASELPRTKPSCAGCVQAGTAAAPPIERPHSRTPSATRHEQSDALERTSR